ncbi:hypothetical protein BDV25DRAFT_162357 [Aspergillus avenaceus]|uniref:Uncharacterized protein n=1 Tax=Aspergillus avenaceus TaxID=36643 RepID=A0A5N6TJE4_ASPAV|nr:hypothetical protein BDV25DRAFT_162357 [Aspergillus avenaceus]
MQHSVTRRSSECLYGSTSFNVFQPPNSVVTGRKLYGDSRSLVKLSLRNSLLPAPTSFALPAMRNAEQRYYLRWRRGVPEVPFDRLH